MKIESMSNLDLLALLLGKDLAERFSNTPLPELFGFRRITPMHLYEPPAACITNPVISAAKELLSRCMVEQMKRESVEITSSQLVKDLLCSKLGSLEHEVFWCLWLDAQNRLLGLEEMFRGTINQTSVYPREIVKRAMSCNAAAVIFSHNHPSGNVEPSPADRRLTSHLKSALELVGVRVLDHVIVSGTLSRSFAEHGELVS